jgi:hypothetical protein
MTHEEKLNYMKVAAGVVGFCFKPEGIDMLVSIYDLVLRNRGETDLKMICEVQAQVNEREEQRLIAEKIKEKSINETTI